MFFDEKDQKIYVIVVLRILSNNDYRFYVHILQKNYSLDIKNVAFFNSFIDNKYIFH